MSAPPDDRSRERRGTGPWRHVDLAAARLGGRVLLANDEFFAAADNLLKPEPPEFRAGVYTDRGKWMDGWESRRRREPGHDWCVIRLASPGFVHEAVVDTTHFRGNHPESCSLDGLFLEDADEDGDDGAALAAGVDWHEILPRTTLAGDSPNRLTLIRAPRITHVRLNIYPDGGVARLRLHGEVAPDWERLAAEDSAIDLAAILHGGCAIACSDQAFADPQNLLLPGPAEHMGEGWETRRRRGPGDDWVVVRLGRRGLLQRLEIDTSHFKGNHPESASVERCDAPADTTADATADATADDIEDMEWLPLLPRTPLEPDRSHEFDLELMAPGPATHLRLRIYPDGGVARLRAFGRPSPGGA